MFTLPELRAIVNDHRKTYARQARSETNQVRQKELERTRDAFEQLDDWLAGQDLPGGRQTASEIILGDDGTTDADSGSSGTSNARGTNGSPAYWTTEDLSDIPEDLIEELGLNKANPIDRNLVSIIEDAGEPLTVNAVVLGYLRKFGERLPREKVARKLYRMTTPRGRRVLVIPKGMRGHYGLAAWGDASHQTH